jgi:hypothetical protein
MNFLRHPSLRAVDCPSQRPGEANGPPEWANRKLFEALRPSFCDLVSKPGDGSKSSCKYMQISAKGCAKVSFCG